MVDGWLMIFIVRVAIPPRTNNPRIISGILGKFLTIKRRCGWMNTKNTQKIAKYNMYGVKIENSKAMPNIKE